MDPARLIEQAKRIAKDAGNENKTVSALAEARELLRTYAGEKSAFYKTLLAVDQKWSDDYIGSFVRETLNGFVQYIENGLLEGMSVRRQARVDVVSDFLEQAQILLNTNGVHPAAPAVLIGASLEEFLRNWVEDADVKLGARKPSIDSYSGALREAELITKQDAKDIASWGGIRNHAAHGEFAEVSDSSRIKIMLEGVNLFMRRYTK